MISVFLHELAGIPCSTGFNRVEPLKKVCKKSVNCDKIELISQEPDFLWQEEKRTNE